MTVLQSILKILLFLIPPLLLTIAVEGALTFLIFRKVRYLYYVLLLNILTNPLLNFIMLLYYSYIGMNHYYILLYVLEVVVVIVEGFIFAKLTDIKIPKALLVSLVLNVGSYLFGLWVF